MKKIQHFLLIFIGLSAVMAFSSPAGKSPQEAYIEKYGDTGWTGIVILLIVSVVINGALM